MSRVSMSALQLAALLTVALVIGGVGAALVDQAPTDLTGPDDRPQPDDGTGTSTFASVEEFRSYLRATDATGRHASR